MAASPLTSAQLEAEHRFAAALTEAHEQLANGWTACEVATVLEDAAAVIDDLRVA